MRVFLVIGLIALAAYLASPAWYLLNIAVRALPDMGVTAGLVAGWLLGAVTVYLFMSQRRALP